MKIPPTLHAEVLARHGRGETSSTIAQALSRDFGIEVDSSGIRRLVARAREERAEVAKSEIRAMLRKTLVPALQRLSKIGARAEAMERQLRKEAAEWRKKAKEDPEAFAAAQRCDSLALKAMDRQLAAADLLLHHAGLDTPDQPGQDVQTSQQKREKLLRRLQELCGTPAAKDKDPPVQ